MTSSETKRAASPASIPASKGNGGALTLGNRFIVSVVAFQRSRQLQGGARPRIEVDGHKHPQLAVLEVLADTVSWSVQEKVTEVAKGG
jgi:DNA-directed RNA polymerase subunit K/omega